MSSCVSVGKAVVANSRLGGAPDIGTTSPLKLNVTPMLITNSIVQSLLLPLRGVDLFIV
ncbi:hypothetical protein D3C76_1707920 [compost metagenome]